MEERGIEERTEKVALDHINSKPYLSWRAEEEIGDRGKRAGGPGKEKKEQAEGGVGGLKVLYEQID